MKYDVDSINKRKKYANTVKKVLAVILVILIYNIILIFISAENDGIELFGYRAYVITSDSMEPAINNGDAIVVKNCEEEDLQTGDVITFEQKQEVITHRIQKIEEDQTTKEKTYITKGDNNNMEDSEHINFSAIIGKCVLTIPYLGNIISVLENKLIILIIILIILILFFLKIQKQEKLENRREKKKIEEEKR